MPTVGFDLGAVAALIAALAAAYGSFRLLKVNRRKVIAEASDAATSALERALVNVERYNARLREDLEALEVREDELVARIDELERASADALERAGALAVERDELLERVGVLEARLRARGRRDAV